MIQAQQQHILYCDPSTPQELLLWYNNQEQRLTHPKSENILLEITKLIKHESIEAIVVVNRAQSFTLIRILVAICNTLAYTQKVALYEISEPIVDFSELSSIISTQQSIESLTPYYSQAPNIS